MVRKDKELELNWETLFSVGAFSGNDFYEFYLNDNIRPADSSEISVERSKLYRDPDMLQKVSSLHFVLLSVFNLEGKDEVKFLRLITLTKEKVGSAGKELWPPTGGIFPINRTVIESQCD